MSPHQNPPHQNHEPPAQFRYAVGIGLGVLIGGAVGLFVDNDQFLAFALAGAAAGLLLSYFAKFLRP